MTVIFFHQDEIFYAISLSWSHAGNGGKSADRKMKRPRQTEPGRAGQEQHNRQEISLISPEGARSRKKTTILASWLKLGVS